ncbi:MAG: hypothetical protein KatS3mg095_0074 [Candidatus Parcubacteria bacterium]|nr:MAG: hypothetical protein KatS3mg095_0074 [Candidatus Parcubacteria bacterium]
MNNSYILSILPEELETIDKSDYNFNPNFILIYLYKENNELFINTQKIMDFADNRNKETIIRTPEGNYKLKVFSVNGNLLEEINFNPSNNNYEIIAIPNYLNIGNIELIKILQNQKEDISLSSLSVCNENNICERSEENLCPLDCPQVKNNNYPLTTNSFADINQSINEIQPTLTQQITLSSPQNYFYQIIIITVLGLILISFLGYIIIKKIKK